MPNMGMVLKEEITRLARKELRGQTEVIRKAVAGHRKKIIGIRRTRNNHSSPVNRNSTENTAPA